MPLAKCVKEHTHREYLTWLAWLEEQWNQPDRSDHYTMMVAKRIIEFAEAFSKDPRSITLDQQKIKFERVKPPEEEPKPTVEQEKSLWAGIVGTTLRKLRGK